MFDDLATPFEHVGPSLQTSRHAVERPLAALRDKNIKRALDAEETGPMDNATIKEFGPTKIK